MCRRVLILLILVNVLCIIKVTAQQYIDTSGIIEVFFIQDTFEHTVLKPSGKFIPIRAKFLDWNIDIQGDDHYFAIVDLLCGFFKEGTRYKIDSKYSELHQTNMFDILADVDTFHYKDKHFIVRSDYIFVGDFYITRDQQIVLSFFIEAAGFMIDTDFCGLDQISIYQDCPVNMFIIDFPFYLIAKIHNSRSLTLAEQKSRGMTKLNINQLPVRNCFH